MRIPAAHAVAGLAAIAAITAGGYAAMTLCDAPKSSVCDSVAAYITSQPDIAAGDFEGTVLQNVDGRLGSPIDGAVPQTLGVDFEDNEADYESFKDALRDKFRPSPALYKAMAEQVLYGEIEIASPQEYGIHALMSTSGSASCTSYMFFESEAGKNAELISQKPESIADEACLNARTAYLATIGDESGFVSDFIGDDPSGEAIAITPWNGKDWQSSCHVDVVFEQSTDAAGRKARGKLASAKAGNGPEIEFRN